jgi:predicted RNA-binding protein
MPSRIGVDVTLVNEWAEVVVFEDVLGDVRNFNPHVLKVVG